MGHSALPTTLVFCCPLPASLSDAELAACLDADSHASCVTWAATVERLPHVMDRLGSATSAHRVGLLIPSGAAVSRQSLRGLLTAVNAASPGIDTAWIRGPLPHDCRRMLVDAGIGVVLRDRLEFATRGVRRPAPNGWPCRSILWGLWEVTTAAAVPPGMIGRILPWANADRPRPGGLAVVDLAGDTPSPSAIRDRLDRWHSWARSQRVGGVEVAALSTLPDLITGAARRPWSGSVLKAA